MEKRNGFTLIELLAILSILATILLIAVPSITNIIEKSKKQTFVNSSLLITNTAQKRFVGNTTNIIDINDLKKEISFSDKYEGNIVLYNGKFYTTIEDTVNGYYFCGILKDKINVSAIEVDECSNLPSLNLSAPTNWTKDSVDITLEVIDINQEGFEYIILPNENNDKITASDFTDGIYKFTVYNNDTHIFTLKNNDTFSVQYSIDINNIDKTVPIISITSEEVDNKTKLIINTNDEHSGVNKIVLNNDIEFKNESNNKNFSITHDITQNGTYNFKVYDNVLNENETSIVINVIDSTPPTLTLTPDKTNWTNQDIYIKASSPDEDLDYIILPNGDRVANGTSYLANKNGEYFFTAVDTNGNRITQSINITNIDKSEPNINYELDPESWTTGKVIIFITANDININTDETESGIDYILTPSNKIFSSTTSFPTTINEKFDFIAVDKAGNSKKISVEVNNIYKCIPTDEKYFTFNGGKITNYNIAGGIDVCIPPKISGEIVTTIEDSAFFQKGITSVIMPDTIIYIGSSAFSNNALTSVVIPNSVTTIKFNAFSNNALTSVVISNSLTDIEGSIFAYNALTNVVIPNSVTSIGIDAFRENALTSVVIPNSVTAIGNGGFLSNALTSVVIPNSLIYTGYHIFYSNALTTVVIPNGVSSIGENMFAYNSLTNVVIPNSVTSIGNSAFDYNIATRNELRYNSAVCSPTTPYGCLDNASCTSNGGEIASNGVCYKKMDIDCFTIYNTNTITDYNRTCGPNVVIPNSITTIKNSAFYNDGLISVVIPNSVTDIGSSAFKNNVLTSVVIPNSVTSIGSSAFDNNRLTNVVIPNSVTDIGSSAFKNNVLTSVVIPNSVTSIGSSAFYNNRLTNVIIPNSVTSIGSSAFNNNRLTNIVIPNSVTSIGSSAFYNNRLTSLKIESNGINLENRFNDMWTDIGFPSHLMPQ